MDSYTELTKALLMGFCIWSLIWLIIHIFVIRFVVPKYEKETGLIETAFFREVLPFARYTPSFWSSGFYIVHFLFCEWLWKWAKKSKVFRDIENVETVTGQFTQVQRWLIHIDTFCAIIAGVHALAVSIS